MKRLIIGLGLVLLASLACQHPQIAQVQPAAQTASAGVAVSNAPGR